MLSGGSYLVHRASSGELVLTAEGAASVSRTYDIEPGKTYYVEFSTGFTSVNLRLVDEREGVAAIEGLRQK